MKTYYINRYHLPGDDTPLMKIYDSIDKAKDDEYHKFFPVTTISIEVEEDFSNDRFIIAVNRKDLLG